MDTDQERTQDSRRQLIEDALDELSRHTPAGMMRSIRRWSSGRLSMVNLQVLMLLAEEGSTPMGALADALDVSQASATGIVDRMEERGLVERVRDEDDRRVVKVTLTETGRQLMVGLATERRERLGMLLEELSDEELSALLRGSRALRQARERLVTSCTDHAHAEQGEASR